MKNFLESYEIEQRGQIEKRFLRPLRYDCNENHFIISLIFANLSKFLSYTSFYY